MIDIKFSSLQDTPKDKYGNYKDPDRYSQKLREYHMLLWSKDIDSGHFFGLHPYPKGRMIHRSDSMEFVLSSDSIGHTYRKWDEMTNIVSHISLDEMNAFKDEYSILLKVIIMSD